MLEQWGQGASHGPATYWSTGTHDPRGNGATNSLSQWSTGETNERTLFLSLSDWRVVLQERTIICTVQWAIPRRRRRRPILSIPLSFTLPAISIPLIFPLHLLPPSIQRAISSTRPLPTTLISTRTPTIPPGNRPNPRRRRQQQQLPPRRPTVALGFRRRATRMSLARTVDHIRLILSLFLFFFLLALKDLSECLSVGVRVVSISSDEERFSSFHCIQSFQAIVKIDLSPGQRIGV